MILASLHGRRKVVYFYLKTLDEYFTVYCVCTAKCTKRCWCIKHETISTEFCSWRGNCDSIWKSKFISEYNKPLNLNVIRLYNLYLKSSLFKCISFEMGGPGKRACVCVCVCVLKWLEFLPHNIVGYWVLAVNFNNFYIYWGNAVTTAIFTKTNDLI